MSTRGTHGKSLIQPRGQEGFIEEMTLRSDLKTEQAKRVRKKQPGRGGSEIPGTPVFTVSSPEGPDAEHISPGLTPGHLHQDSRMVWSRPACIWGCRGGPLKARGSQAAGFTLESVWGGIWEVSLLPAVDPVQIDSQGCAEREEDVPSV